VDRDSAWMTLPPLLPTVSEAFINAEEFGLYSVEVQSILLDGSLSDAAAFEFDMNPIPTIESTVLGGMEVDERGNEPTFLGPDAEFTIRRPSILMLPELGGEPSGAGSGDDMAGFRDYEWEVWTADPMYDETAVHLHTAYTQDERFAYTLTLNKMDQERVTGSASTLPIRSFYTRVRLRTRIQSTTSQWTGLMVTNPAPEIPVAVFSPGPASIFFDMTLQDNDLDYAGIRIWGRPTDELGGAGASLPDSDLVDEHLLHSGTDLTDSFSADEGSEYALRYAAADAFSTQAQSLLVSDTVHVTAGTFTDRVFAHGVLNVSTPSVEQIYAEWTTGDWVWRAEWVPLVTIDLRGQPASQVWICRLATERVAAAFDQGPGAGSISQDETTPAGLYLCSHAATDHGRPADPIHDTIEVQALDGYTEREFDGGRLYTVGSLIRWSSSQDSIFAGGELETQHYATAANWSADWSLYLRGSGDPALSGFVPEQVVHHGIIGGGIEGVSTNLVIADAEVTSVVKGGLGAERVNSDAAGSRYGFRYRDDSDLDWDHLHFNGLDFTGKELDVVLWVEDVSGNQMTASAGLHVRLVSKANSANWSEWEFGTDDLPKGAWGRLRFDPNTRATSDTGGTGCDMTDVGEFGIYVDHDGTTTNDFWFHSISAVSNA
jgi:hypothetical protein